MKRCFVAVASIALFLLLGVYALGVGSFYSEYSGNYLILLPDSKTNKDLASSLGGVVYTDSALTLKAADSSVAATGRYFSLSGKKYEIIVKGDKDGDGFVLYSDVSSAKNAFKSSLSSVRDMHIYDVNRDGKFTATDYVWMKAHITGYKKIAETFVPDKNESSTETSEDSSIDPDWVNQCEISVSGGKTTINGTGASVSGNVINITDGGEYTVSGKITNGMIQVNSTAKVKIRLSNAEISNSSGPAILFASADKAFITVANGTVNRLSDGSSYSNGKGTIHSEADLEIKGKGTLYVTANYRHGISCDEDLSIENGIITIQNAVKDGIHAKKSVEIIGGDITIKNCAGDAVDCEGTSSLTKGTVTITGGKLTVTGVTGDGINALGNVAINNGVVNISTQADCIKTDAYVYVSGTASLVLNAGSDGINSVKGINVSGGTMKVNATEYTLKSDANISITGGSLTLEGVREKIYAIGNVNIAAGTVK